MKKTMLVAALFVFAFTLGLSQVLFTEAQAKPTQCRLAIEPFLYCIPSNACKEPGQMRCWECMGTEPDGTPCLCSLVGCYP